MENVKQTIKGSKLILEIDLDETLHESGSGKSDIIASTYGNQPVTAYNKRNVVLSVNCYEPKKKSRR